MRQYRRNSKSPPTRKLAKTPTLYHVNVIPKGPFLSVPETSSERREYIPIAWLKPPSVPSNAVRIIPGADKSVFGLLSSAMHVSWVSHIGGRLKSDYRHSIGLVYNTFPIPPGGEAALSKLEPLAQAVLDARAQHPDETLADLYDPDLTPPELRKAHRALDRAVDRLYRKSGFSSDLERAEHLLELYENMADPLAAAAHPKRGRRKKK